MNEHDRRTSDWTADHLKILHDQAIEAVEKAARADTVRLEQAIAAQERAVALLAEASRIAQDKFEATVRDGFVKQNEFRGSLDDLGKTMATRRELEDFKRARSQRDELVDKSISELRSRLDIGPAALSQLQAFQNQQTGRNEGISASLGVVVALVTVGAALIGMVVVLANVLTR